MSAELAKAMQSIREISRMNDLPISELVLMLTVIRIEADWRIRTLAGLTARETWADIVQNTPQQTPEAIQHQTRKEQQ